MLGARIVNGEVVELLPIPEGQMLSTIVHPGAGFVEAPDIVQIGAKFDGEFFTPPVEVKVSDDFLLGRVRRRRNALLEATDVMVSVPDWPMTAGQKEALLEYRQKLRDLPSAKKVRSIKWPSWPDGLKPPERLRKVVSPE